MKNLEILFISLFTAILGLLPACEKELDLAQFKDDFGSYQPEIRIEAIINTVQVSELGTNHQVVVRVDRSITVDDTTVFNGRDDNGNWQSYTDENGNGQWDSGEPLNDDLGEDGMIGQENGFPIRDKGEGNGKPDYGEPNVDEYDEILPLLHETTAIVSLTNLTRQQNYSLIWCGIAATFQYLGYNREDPLANVYQSSYGGYVSTSDIISNSDTNDIFEFSIELPDRGLTVTGQTRLIPPAVFLDFLLPKVLDTLYVPYGIQGGIMWRSDPRATIYCVRVEFVDESNPDHLLIYEHPNVANRELTVKNGGIPIGFEPIASDLTPGLYHIIVTTMDENYSRYYYSSLPLKDPEKSNLRDQDGNVVMGVAGSKAEAGTYLRILTTIPKK
ncbi:MAG: hypothetical protein V1681_01210 [Candidatus Neomarinimicrobiota bacterium]